MHIAPAGRVIELVRYPVKSLQGETVPETEIELDGMRGDRVWGIRDENTGRILTGRRMPQLLFASAALAADGAPLLTLPTGVTCQGPGEATDAALSEWLGRPVHLISSHDSPPARAEFFEDSTDDSSPAIEWTMPAGRFVDAMPLLVLTTASLRTAAALYPGGDWQVRRFRPNLFLDVDGDGWLEDAWCGLTQLRIGDAILRPDQPCIRCTMPTRPQPGLDDDRDIFRTLARNHRGCFGAWTAVATAGTVRVGDEVHVEPLSRQPGDPLLTG
jgi:uncharacterized protein YcbX